MSVPFTLKQRYYISKFGMFLSSTYHVRAIIYPILTRLSLTKDEYDQFNITETVDNAISFTSADGQIFDYDITTEHLTFLLDTLQSYLDERKEIFEKDPENPIFKYQIPELVSVIESLRELCK